MTPDTIRRCNQLEAEIERLNRRLATVEGWIQRASRQPPGEPCGVNPPDCACPVSTPPAPQGGQFATEWAGNMRVPTSPAETHTDARELVPQPTCEHGRPGGWLCPHCHPVVTADTPMAGFTPPAPQRFWTVEQTVTGCHWRAYETDAKGNVMLGFERLWDTRWQAEADGAASGLPKWRP
jgi:hypothetical protein